MSISRKLDAIYKQYERDNLKTFQFSRRDKGAAWLALAALTSAFLLSVSSTKADVTTWNNFTVGDGLGPNAATSGSDFSTATLNIGGGSGVSIISGTINSLSYMDSNDGGGATCVLNFQLSVGGTFTLTTLEYSYSYNVKPGTTIDWNLNGHDLGSTAISGAGGNGDDSIDLTAGGNNPVTSNDFTLIGTVSGTAEGNNVDFDHFSITAVPEPVNCALAGFGLLFVASSAGRFYLARRRSTTASQ